MTDSLIVLSTTQCFGQNQHHIICLLILMDVLLFLGDTCAISVYEYKKDILCIQSFWPPRCILGYFVYENGPGLVSNFILAT